MSKIRTAIILKRTKNDKEERYSRVPRLSKTRVFENGDTQNYTTEISKAGDKKNIFHFWIIKFIKNK